MPLTISIELLTGSYDAAEVDDRDRPEWPPHPARLFCALVAAARTNDDHAALRWLEAQPPPVIRAADQAQEARRSAYVVVNKRSDSGGNLTHPGRTNGLRVRARALPTSPRVTMSWADTASAEVVRALDAMGRRIPYLGRSTGITLVAAATTEDPIEPADGDLVVFEPCDLLDRELSLRVAYPGYLDELDAQFAADRPAWEVSRYQGYRRVTREPEADDPQVPSVYEDVLVFGFSGLKPQGRLAVRFTEALRSAALRAAGRDAPAVLHGHGADGRPHVAFLALPDVGHTHADGHLLGMAVAVPDLPADERKSVLQAVLGLRGHHDLVEFAVPGIGRVELIYQPGHVRPWGASPDRWRQGSRRWATATPIVLDRYPKRPAQVEDEVRAGLYRVGLPEAVDIAISPHPVLPGAVPLRPNDLPRQTRGRLFRHVAVTFDRTVRGPVLV